MKAIAIVLSLWLAWPAQACIWIMGTTKDGERKRARPTAGWQLRRQLENSIKTDLRTEGAARERELRGNKGHYARNDYGVALMYLGRPEEAVEVLLALEREIPGQYETAANLGTACELSGRNREAKRWIEEGIRRNADSHAGTEWLHVRILEAKIQQEEDRGYFDKHSVLNLDYRTLEARDGKIAVAGAERAIRDVHEALRYQLTERLKFVKTPDVVVASLVFDFAAIEAATGTLETASSLLKLAQDYGYPPQRILPLLAAHDRMIFMSKLKTRMLITGGLLLIAAGLGYGWKRGSLVLSREKSVP